MCVYIYIYIERERYEYVYIYIYMYMYVYIYIYIYKEHGLRLDEGVVAAGVDQLWEGGHESS